MHSRLRTATGPIIAWADESLPCRASLARNCSPSSDCGPTLSHIGAPSLPLPEDARYVKKTFVSLYIITLPLPFLSFRSRHSHLPSTRPPLLLLRRHQPCLSRSIRPKASNRASQTTTGYQLEFKHPQRWRIRNQLSLASHQSNLNKCPRHQYPLLVACNFGLYLSR